MDINKLINNNFQYFIEIDGISNNNKFIDGISNNNKFIDGISNNNKFIDGIQKMILHCLGIEQELSNIPYQSISLFETISTTECINREILIKIKNL